MIILYMNSCDYFICEFTKTMNSFMNWGYQVRICWLDWPSRPRLAAQRPRPTGSGAGGLHGQTAGAVTAGRGGSGGGGNRSLAPRLFAAAAAGHAGGHRDGRRSRLGRAMALAATRPAGGTTVTHLPERGRPAATQLYNCPNAAGRRQHSYTIA